MSLIKGLKRDGRRSGNGEYSSNPVSNVAVLVTGYELQGNKASPDDVLEGILLHDACGITAEFDANDVPITPIRVKLEHSDRVSQFEESRHSIFDMCVGRDGKRTQEEGSVIMLDKARLDSKSGVVTAKWIRRGTPDLDNSKLHWLMPNTMTCVTPQTAKERDGKPNYRQSRYFVWTHDAVKIENGPNAVENARAAMESVLDGLVGGETPPPGQAAFILRVAGLDENGNADTASVNGYLQWDRESDQDKSSADSVSEFMTTGDGAKYMDILAQQHEGLTWEVIPMIIVKTGLRSLPASRIEEALKNGKAVQDYQDFKSDAAGFRVGDGREAVYGFVPANTILQRSEKNEMKVGEDGKSRPVKVVGRWFATSSQKIDVYSRRVYTFDELVTPNLPAEVVKAIETVVDARAEAANKASQERRSGSAASEEKAPESEESQDKGYSFGR